MLHRGPRQVEAFQPPHAGALPFRQDFLLVGQIVGDGVGAATSHALSSVKRRERPVCDLITGSCLGPSGDGNNSELRKRKRATGIFCCTAETLECSCREVRFAHVSGHRQPSRSGPKSATTGLMHRSSIQRASMRHKLTGKAIYLCDIFFRQQFEQAFSD